MSAWGASVVVKGACSGVSTLATKGGGQAGDERADERLAKPRPWLALHPDVEASVARERKPHLHAPESVLRGVAGLR